MRGDGQSTEPAAETRTELGLAAGEGGGGPQEASLLPGSGLSWLTAHPCPEEAIQTPMQATLSLQRSHRDDPDRSITCMHRREHEQVQKLRGAPRNRAHKVTRVGTPTRPGTHLTAGHTDMHTYTHRLRYTHTRSQSSQVHIHVYGNARHRNTHSSATESHCLQLRPTSEFPRRLYPRDPISIWPRHLKVPPHLAIPTRSQPQAQPGFTVKFRSTPSPALPSVTHHPKPPKETLRFLPNIVVAGGAPGPATSPELLARLPQPGSSGVHGLPRGAGHPLWHLPHRLPPNPASCG